MDNKDGKFYLFQKKEEPKPSKAKLILFSVITLVWLAGVVTMFLNRPDIGIICWAVSFAAAFVVYLKQRNKSTLDELREAEMLAGAKQEGDDAGAQESVRPGQKADGAQDQSGGESGQA